MRICVGSASSGDGTECNEMDWERTVGGYALVMGAVTLVIWALTVDGGPVMEPRTDPFSLFASLVLGGLTGVSLLVAGAGLVRRQLWARPLSLVAFGLLFAGVIDSAGYYAAVGRVGVVVALFVVCLATLAALGWSLVDARNRARRAAW
ncbi:hypothetical protein BN996_03730 [Haloferax massiliensis]|uniref:DUF8058 domain-containing protein n=3 Tax=Haloferax TaxID=2251 RepID=A0A0D6JWH7_9EURY|nr:hypothetical protein BN996_03730 [Haloferax massiliensis]